MIDSSKKINLINIGLIFYIMTMVIFDEGSPILKISRLLFVGIFIILFVFVKKKVYIDKYTIWMIVFAIFSLISSIWAIFPSTVYDKTLTIVLNDICIFCIINMIIVDEKKWELSLKTIFFSSILLGIRIATQNGIFIYASGVRGQEGLASANLVGMVAAISVVIGFYILFDKKCKYKSIYYVGIILNIVILILSASRKALLFLTIPIGVFYILRSRNIVKTLIRVVLFTIIVFCIYILIMNNTTLYNIVGYRFETMINGFIGDGEVDGSTSLRLKMIDWGIEWFKEKPMLRLWYRQL